MKRATCVRRLAGLALVAALAAVPLAAQDQDFSKVEIKVIPVAGGIYMLQGAGGISGCPRGATAS